MSTPVFHHARLVVLRPTATLAEAARALGDNHVGAVLVGEGHDLVGIVTDRDIALHVASGDGATTTLRDLVSGLVVTCPVDATVDDILCAMRQGACRRVPILERGRPVGIVTLDDLVLDRAVTLEQVRSVVEAQLTRPARLKPEGTTRLDSGAHDAAELLYDELVAHVEHLCGLARPRATRLLHVALRTIVEGLGSADAAAVLARLPRRVGLGGWADGELPRREPAEVWADMHAAARLMPSASLDLLVEIAGRLDVAASSSCCHRALERLLPRGSGEESAPDAQTPR